MEITRRQAIGLLAPALLVPGATANDQTPTPPDQTEGEVRPGSPHPMGATPFETGINFALYSEHASKVELCLFDRLGEKETRRIELPGHTGPVWHGYIPNLPHGQLYGYRVHGPFDPAKGLRFNPSKLLVDPYAAAIAGSVDWKAPVFGYEIGNPGKDLTIDTQDDAAGVPKGVAGLPPFDWGEDRAPRTPLADSIIYEVHVKGFTAAHPGVPAALRGTYAGLASPSALGHLKSLGITAVELMPVHEFIDNKYLLDRGLRNYWGYDTLNYFSPAARYSSSGDRGGQVNEFKAMVKALHSAGIEVILDVVYNHTCEGNEAGPTLSFRGIDNPTYYLLAKGNPRIYLDRSGTGNTLNAGHEQTRRLIMDSLRYWVQEMHVDGFRFDLASALTQSTDAPFAGLFETIYQDPFVSQVKLIAEPWDASGQYQSGRFPGLWAEWNARYRDAVRLYWRGDEGQLAALAYRLTGSSDLFGSGGRRPSASINYVTVHDGFTLHDLVTYAAKHNEANGDGNRDGVNDNKSWNCGVEGPSNDPQIIELRERQKRNLLATLLFSQGVPMICGGDEFDRDQRGNNNAYSQDNEITWHNWNLDGRRTQLLDFTRRLIAFRRRHPNLRRRRFFQDRPIRGAAVRGSQPLEVKDISWLRTDGKEMTDEEWNAGWIRCMGLQLGGETIDEVDDQGKPVTDDTLLILMNSHYEAVPFYPPSAGPQHKWEIVFDTNRPGLPPGSATVNAGARLDVYQRSVALLRAVT